MEGNTFGEPLSIIEARDTDELKIGFTIKEIVGIGFYNSDAIHVPEGAFVVKDEERI